MHSPFRAPPKVELGPLAVGLRQAAARAMSRVPSGGRIVKQGPARRATHTQGALGCTGLVLAAGAVFVAVATGWLPRTHVEFALLLGGVLIAGACLAAVLQALDRARPLPTCEAQPVSHAARLVARRLARLAACADHDPPRFGARRINALRRALSAAAEPALLAWIPDDVRGRAELLLARALVAHARADWTRDRAVRSEVQSLLARAAKHLDDPSPAEADISALDASPLPPVEEGRSTRRRRASSPPRAGRRRFATALLADATPATEDDEAEHEEMHARARRRRERRLDVIP